MTLILHSLLAIEGLYDPPRLMVSEATLDVPSATNTSNAEPQQGASSAHTTPVPTAASDVLPGNSLDAPGPYSLATEQASHHDAEDPTSVTAATESQTPDFSAETQNDASTSSTGSLMASDADSSTTMEPQIPDFSAGVQSNGPSSAGGSPITIGVDTSTSHTALMESQTPNLVPGSQSRASSTTASSPLANEASTDTQSDSASASSTGTSVGVSLASKVKGYAAVGLFLFFSFIA